MELKAYHDSRQSFYGKASTRYSRDRKRLILTSYQTDVAYIDFAPVKRLVVKDTHSATTLRHIKEFAAQNGFDAPTKAYIEEHYMPKEE